MSLTNGTVRGYQSTRSGFMGMNVSTTTGETMATTNDASSFGRTTNETVATQGFVTFDTPNSYNSGAFELQPNNRLRCVAKPGLYQISVIICLVNTSPGDLNSTAVKLYEGTAPVPFANASQAFDQNGTKFFHTMGIARLKVTDEINVQISTVTTADAEIIGSASKIHFIRLSD